MSYVITAIISMIFGAGIMACCKVSGGCSERERQKEALKEAHLIGYKEGHHNGLRKGKALKIDAALYEEPKGRVGVAPEQKIISKALVDEMVYGGPRRGGMMCELEGMRFKSAKIVSKDEAPRVLSCDRVDKAPGFDSIRDGKV